jgi:hypothetical protein
MRKLLLSALLASAAATPALAAPGDPSDRQEMRAERQQAREERQQVHEERAVQVERPHFSGSSNVQGGSGNNHQVVGRSQHVEQSGQQNPQQTVQQDTHVRAQRGGNDVPDTVRNARIERRQQIQAGQADTLQQPNHAVPHVFRNRTPVVSDTPRVGTQPPLRVERRHTPEVRWSTNWRNDHRYDWHNWRDRHRSWFHLGFYYDPFGWGYQPYSIGWRLWPSYYGSNYWINDPYQYRLPYAPPGTRWVRYYNDAILVDTWSGEVVDVIYNFFW